MTSGTHTTYCLIRPKEAPIESDPERQAATLASDGTFRLPLTLTPGLNPVLLSATSALGQTVSLAFTLIRTGAEPSSDAAPSIHLDWPLDGFAVSSPSVAVRGRVNQATLQVQVAGQAVTVDPLTLQFATEVSLNPGRSTLLAQPQDGRGGRA